VNKDRRHRIQLQIDRILTAKQELEEIRDEEDEAQENMPESLHGTEKHDAMLEAVELLDNVVTALDDAITELEQAQIVGT
jgi:hypothetical protein